MALEVANGSMSKRKSPRNLEFTETGDPPYYTLILFSFDNILMNTKKETKNYQNLLCFCGVYVKRWKSSLHITKEPTDIGPFFSFHSWHPIQPQIFSHFLVWASPVKPGASSREFISQISFSPYLSISLSLTKILFFCWKKNDNFGFAKRQLLLSELGFVYYWMGSNKSWFRGKGIRVLSLWCLEIMLKENPVELQGSSSRFWTSFIAVQPTIGLGWNSFLGKELYFWYACLFLICCINTRLNCEDLFSKYTYWKLEV